MRAMARLERFFERLVERPSARLFRTRVQPVHVLRRIERAMEADRDRGSAAGRDLVPDRYTVRLHPLDLAGVGDLAAVAEDLASGALRFARGHGYAVRERPRVALHADPVIEAGEIEVRATFSAPPEANPVDRSEASTRVYEIPVVRTARAQLEIREPGRAPRRVPLGGEPIQIGRAPDCDLILLDNRISRHHARLRSRAGLLVLSDLGSTNGTFVNGQRIQEVVLGDGDRIQLGETRLAVEREPDAEAVAG